MRRLALCSIAAGLAVVVTATPVAAAVGTTARSPLHAGAGPSTTVSPSGCYQQADTPHRSLHFGWIAGEVKTQCRSTVPQISQVAQLWERRWWGWDRVGEKSTKTVYWKRYQPIWANVSCRKSWIKVTGSGSVVDVDGNTYYASTASAAVYDPCDL